MQKTLPKITPGLTPETEGLLPGTVISQYVRCGKAGCRCTDGKELHGPYLYRFWREGGKLRKQYVSQRNAAQVKAACKGWQEHRVKVRQRRANGRETISTLREMAKAMRSLEASLRMMRGL